MNRRRFLQQASYSAMGMALSSRMRAGDRAIQAGLTVGSSLQTAMTVDFNGLSYETPQLSNPKYFSASNVSLVREFSKLSSSGVLRLGGSLSDFTFWQYPGGPPLSTEQEAAIDHAKTYFEWVLVDPIARANRRPVIGPESFHELRGFLDATGWRLIYGLNLGSGSPEQASLTAEAVSRIVGSKLIALQLGNEADFFGDGRRPKPWGFSQYWADYERFVTAIRSRTPKAQFAGPDVAVRTDWVVDYAQAVQRDAVLLSKHHYAMGPPNDRAMNAQRLLGPDADLAAQMAPLLQASQRFGLPCRMTEVNSCFHGGKPGVSDAYVSALWAADLMLEIAREGWSGINFHGGGMGIYAPIVGDTATGYTARPITMGMRLAEQSAGGRFVQCTVDAAGANMKSYLVQKGSSSLLTIINKGPAPALLSLAGTPFSAERIVAEWTLSAPSLSSTTEAKLNKNATQDMRQRHGELIPVEAYAAVLLEFHTDTAGFRTDTRGDCSTSGG